MRAALAFVALAGCATPFPGELTGGLFESYRDLDVTIASMALFEPERYLGTWYEVARYPVVFERGCVGVTAEYQKIDDDTISVFNTCRDLDGNVASEILGSADIVGPGRLKVSFPFLDFNGYDLSRLMEVPQ